MKYTREIADETEELRRLLMKQMKDQPASYQELVAQYGVHNVWTTEQVTELYEITSFMSPYCTCVEKVTGRLGAKRLRIAQKFN